MIFAGRSWTQSTVSPQEVLTARRNMLGKATGESEETLSIYRAPSVLAKTSVYFKRQLALYSNSLQNKHAFAVDVAQHCPNYAEPACESWDVHATLCSLPIVRQSPEELLFC